MGQVLMERTQEMLRDPLLGGQDVDATVRSLLKAEYLRRLAQYRRVDHRLSQKYEMTLDEFISLRMVERQDYSWEVESDAMDWETAIGGIRTMERKLEELQAIERVHS